MNQTIRRKRRNSENRIKLVVVLILTAILLIFIFNVMLSSSPIQGDVDISHKGYIAITVHADDTLWSIAEEHMNSNFYTFESFIDEVCSMNNIETSTIYAGEQILIPVIASDIGQ